MSATRATERRADRRKAAQALLVSAIIHAVVIIAVAWFYVRDFMMRPAPAEEVTITLIEPPPQPEEKTRFVDTTAPESRPQENARFESDRDTAAASPDAAKGGEALPTQDGREQPFVDLEQKELAMAKPDTAPPAPEMPAVPPAPSSEQAPPKPAPTSKPPQREDSIAMATPTPTPETQNQHEAPTLPPPRPAAKPSFQRQARATKLSGSVSNRGRSAVASMATPLGRYRKAISDAIGSSWYQFIGPRMDLFSYGTVKVVFIVDGNGKVRRPRVTSNTSNESFEIITLQSILAAELPPIPPDILPTLEGGQIEIDYTFSIITN